MKQINRQLKI